MMEAANPDERLLLRFFLGTGMREQEVAHADPTTGRPEGHYLRIIKEIAERVGVVGAGCHRFRDTFATEQVRARVLDLRDIAKIMGHENLEMMKLYAAFVDLQSEQARKAANVSDRFGVQPVNTDGKHSSRKHRKLLPRFC
jgi:hypothetical protein